MFFFFHSRSGRGYEANPGVRVPPDVHLLPEKEPVFADASGGRGE